MGTRRANGENEKLAKALRVSVASIEKYVARGMPVDDIEAARRWRKQNVRPRTGAGREVNETARLRRAQADLAELEAREKAKQVVDVDDVKAVFAEALAILRLRMRGIPGRVAGPLAAMTDPGEIKRYVADEVDRCLGAAAQAFESWGVEAAAGAAGKAAQPAAEALSRPVGGQGQEAAGG